MGYLYYAITIFHLSIVRVGVVAPPRCNIRQNRFFAFIYNAVGVPVAADVLYRLVGVLLSPVTAAVAMSLSSVSAIATALRLTSVE